MRTVQPLRNIVIVWVKPYSYSVSIGEEPSILGFNEMFGDSLGQSQLNQWKQEPEMGPRFFSGVKWDPVFFMLDFLWGQKTTYLKGFSTPIYTFTCTSKHHIPIQW